MVTFANKKMYSDSETSLSNDSSVSIEESEDSGEEWGVLDGQMNPYQDEPLADVDEESADDGEEEADADGLTPAVLEARYERTMNVDSWLVNISKYHALYTARLFVYMLVFDSGAVVNTAATRP